MAEKRKTYRKKRVTTRDIPFHERFQITLGTEEVERKFINRVKNQIFDNFFGVKVDQNTLALRILWQVANGLGEEYASFYSLEHYVNNDFHRTLHVLELAYKALEDQKLKDELSDLIFFIALRSEMNLGVTWEGDSFVKTGAQFLDKALVNEPLRWLANPRYSTVYEPYQKGLKHYLESEKDSSKLSNAITDVYEAIEALCKIVTNRPHKDLSSNTELFISKVGGNKYHKEMLKVYISYANEFRHAAEPGQKKRKIDCPEVENFIYLTGIFIRLAMEKLDKKR